MSKHYKWKLVHSIGGYRIMYLELGQEKYQMWGSWGLKRIDNWYGKNLPMKDINLVGWLSEELGELIDMPWKATVAGLPRIRYLESQLIWRVTDHFYE